MNREEKLLKLLITSDCYYKYVKAKREPRKMVVLSQELLKALRKGVVLLDFCVDIMMK